MASTDPAPESFLPLSTAVFHILVALADGDRHGYAIMQDIAARTDGAVQLSAGTLYSSIRRLLEQGLIEELFESPDRSSTDERRRYYRLTRFGRRVATAEVARLNALVKQARATGLVPGA
jgi:DNA-binding PadR family transcriptional regulator